MRLWLIVIAAGIGTYGDPALGAGVRASQHAAAAGARRAALRDAGGAGGDHPAGGGVHAAAPGTSTPTPGNERLVAALLAAGVAWADEERLGDDRGGDGGAVAVAVGWAEWLR